MARRDSDGAASPLHHREAPRAKNLRLYEALAVPAASPQPNQKFFAALFFKKATTYSLKASS
jgi:hypothetical protein